MKRALPIIIVSIIAIGSVAGAQESSQESFVVIGHPESTPDQVTKRELKLVFLKLRGKWSNGQAAQPVDQAPGEIRSDFSTEMLDKSLHEVDSYWQGQVFAGRSAPPKILGSDQDVIEFVRNNRGAVGYVSSSTDTSGVKVLKITA